MKPEILLFKLENGLSLPIPLVRTILYWHVRVKTLKRKSSEPNFITIFFNFLPYSFITTIIITFSFFVSPFPPFIYFFSFVLPCIHYLLLFLFILSLLYLLFLSIFCFLCPIICLHCIFFHCFFFSIFFFF